MGNNASLPATLPYGVLLSGYQNKHSKNFAQGLIYYFLWFGRIPLRSISFEV
jgi:hypothetical protein